MRGTLAVGVSAGGIRTVFVWDVDISLSRSWGDYPEDEAKQ